MTFDNPSYAAFSRLLRAAEHGELELIKQKPNLAISHVTRQALYDYAKKKNDVPEFLKDIEGVNRRLNEHTLLSDVVRLAYTKHKDPDIPDYYLDFVAFLEGGNNVTPGSDDILSNIAKAIANYVDVYGVHELGEKQIRIEKSELPLSDCKNYFADTGNSIRRKESLFIPITKPIWNNLHIKTDDIEKALEQIKNFED